MRTVPVLSQCQVLTRSCRNPEGGCHRRNQDVSAGDTVQYIIRRRVEEPTNVVVSDSLTGDSKVYLLTQVRPVL
jgi:hypothetical protein